MEVVVVTTVVVLVVVVVAMVVVLDVWVSTFMVVRGSGSAVTNVWVLAVVIAIGNGVGKNGLFCSGCLPSSGCSVRWLMIGKTLGIPSST